MWRHTDGSTSLWLMNGTVAQGFGSFGAIPVTWSILDSQGDYNGDGKNDLLWRNATDGSTNRWLMDGTTVMRAKTRAAADLKGVLPRPAHLGPTR